ncbi:MAG: SEL1-like repeat protein [Prevotella sp.]|nr:SEL1-like repeat protein [Prevotella sp.]
MMKLPSLAEAQKALKGGKDPQSFLHLGVLYAQGIGTAQDDVLATYFIKKALDLGCKEAKEYINMGFIHKHLKFFYPEYNKEKAISDILNYRNSVDADILYSLCTSDNTSEIYIKSQESLLAQLFAPISNEDSLWEYIDTNMLSKDESDLAQCLVNLTYSYDKICRKYNVERKYIYTLESLDLYPYIKIPSLVELRKQAFRCVLSIKDIDSNIRDKYLECLDSDEKLLNVCETIKDQDIQMFLISFVELNIDIESLETTSLSLLHAYRSNNLQPLADHLNNCLNRLTASGIRHSFPVYSVDNLPKIDLCSSND